MTRASDTAKLLGAGATILDGTTISTADNTDSLTLQSTDADANVGPVMLFKRDSSSPAASDFLGYTKYSGENNADEETIYAQTFSQIVDVTNGSEDGTFAIDTMVAGTLRARVEVTPTETVFNEDSIDLDFRIESDNLGNAFFLQGSTGNIGIGTNAPTKNLTIQGTAATLRLEDNTSGRYADIENSDGRMILRSDPDDAVSSSRFIFEVDGSEKARLDGSGNLGLNTAGSTGRATGIGMEILNVGTDTSATLRLTGENGSSAETFSEITHVGDSRLLNFKHNGATRIQIDANGGVLVDGGSVGSVSDSRVKKDVEDLSDGLSIVKQLRPVKFKYKGNTEYYNGDDKTYHGFIADEVKAIAPQYITEVTNKIYDDEYDGSNIVDFDEELKDKKFTSVDDFKTMSQTDLIPMLVKAIQELSAKVTTLENA